MLYSQRGEGECKSPSLLHYSFRRIVNTIVLTTIRSSMIIETTFLPAVRLKTQDAILGFPFAALGCHARKLSLFFRHRHRKGSKKTAVFVSKACTRQTQSAP